MDHGKHIKIQIYGSPREQLKSVGVAEVFLKGVVEAAGMRPLDEPWVYDIREQLEAQGDEPDPVEPEGVTGIVALSTSHAAIHTWPHRGYATIDLFSCRDFSVDVVEVVVEALYKPERHTVDDLSFSLSMPEIIK